MILLLHCSLGWMKFRTGTSRWESDFGDHQSRTSIAVRTLASLWGLLQFIRACSLVRQFHRFPSKTLCPHQISPGWHLLSFAKRPLWRHHVFSRCFKTPDGTPWQSMAEKKPCPIWKWINMGDWKILIKTHKGGWFIICLSLWFHYPYPPVPSGYFQQANHIRQLSMAT